MAKAGIEKERLLEQIMSIKDWRHPFGFGENRIVSLERQELGPWNKWRAGISRKAIETVMDGSKVSILDLACNDGYFSFQLMDKARRVFGLDARAECIRRANLLKQYYECADFEFRQADLRRSDWEKEGLEDAFDLVLCYGILYHLTDPFGFLKKVYKITKNTLSLSTFLSSSKYPVTLLTKEDTSRPGSGLDSVAALPSHSAVVRLLYGAGFDLVLRYLPHKLSLYHHLEWGHFFGIKLGGVSKEQFIRKHNVKAKYNPFIKQDQIVLCEDLYDNKGVRQINKASPANFGRRHLLFHKIKRKFKRHSDRTHCPD